MVWEHRADTPHGLPLYAEQGALPSCPVFVMATLAELAEHGLQSTDLASVVAELGALPVPAGPAVSVSVDERGTKTLSFTSREERYESPLRHDYRVGHDLPEMGGA